MSSIGGIGKGFEPAQQAAGIRESHGLSSQNFTGQLEASAEETSSGKGVVRSLK
jgi:hypothetical protein